MTEREVADLVESLAGLGVRLWVEEGQLRFRAPRGVLTDEWRGRLRDSRDGLLAHLGADPAARDFAPDPAGRYEPFPVTDVQAAYLLGRGSGFAYGGTGCHGYGELTYPSLDPDRLATAWRALIERHDMLRAVIEVDGSQRVLPEVPQLRIVTADLRGRTPEEVDAALAATRAEMDHRVFAPDRWPLFEVRLTLTDTRAVQHVSVDFPIADFVSIQIVLDELHRLYHRPDEPVPPLALTFRDYLQAERSRQAGTRREADRGYWLGRLAELPPAPALPVGDHPRAGEPVRFRRFETRLDTTTWAGLRKRAGQHGVTASGAVLAAYAEVVAAWSRQPRFTLDITLLNRLPLHPQVDRLVGDFTGVDLLAVDADPARPFVERARDLQAQLWQDLDHRAFTGVEVIREIARRDGGDAALFPIVFTSAIGLAEAGGAADGAPVGELGYGISQTPQVWIDCQNIERQGCLATNWDVREGVFPAGLVEDMFDAYRSLLSRLATGDEPWTSTAPVPLPEAQARRRREVNDTAAPVPAGLLHDGVVAQALRTPGRVAVIGPDRTLTYGELLGRAVAVADRLGPVDGLVGVVMDKGWEQVVAVLGILLAGGAYLPVELSQPPLRRRQILAAAGVDRLVSTARVVARGDCPDTALVLDDLVAEPRPVPARAEPDALAYTIFTSGSTGTPKGVMISHRSALNTVVDMNSRFGIGADDRVLGLSSLGFDLSVYDIFGPLATGGCLVLPDPDRRGDPSHWADLAARHGVTVWNSVPAQLQMLHDYLSVTPALALPALRLALLSGDWIPVALPDQIRRQAVGGAAGPRLVSLGGATEAAIWSIYYPIAEVPGDWRSIPYGRPLANQTFHVLGPAMRPCPDWVPGELYIGGTGVALGYLGDAARTAERFVTHPGTGERLYRTGDLGRYLPSGDIEFLGREDFQVKIRGYRIELAEVESALGSHPGVGAAAVVVDGDRPLERRLVGFVEPAPRTEAAPAVLPRGDVGGARLRQNPAPAVLPREQVRGMTAAALAAGEAEVAGVDRDRYLAFAHRLDGVALPAMVDTLRRAGLFPDGAASHTEAGIQSAAGVAPRHRRLVRRWLRALTGQGWLARTGDGYRLARDLAPDQIDSAWAAVDEVVLPAERPLLDYFRASITHLPELLRGAEDPLALLFPEGRLDVSQRLYEDALFNRWANRAAGAAVRAIASGRVSPEPVRVLEVGAGGGGTTVAVLEALAGVPVEYTCTDLSPFFLHTLRERLGDRPGVTYAAYDLDRDYREQGLSPNSYDIVVAGDVLHATANTDAVLARLRELVVPEGWLVALEMTRDHYQIMTSLELLVRFDENTSGGDQVFLSREQWLAALDRAGADSVLCLPEPDGFIAELGMCVLAGRFKAHRVRLDAADLTVHMRQRLPGYMVPAQLVVLDGLPLTGNGKVDRKALAAWVPRRGGSAPVVEAVPASPLEDAVGAIWAQALSQPHIGRDDNLFDLGGDSLVAAQITGRVLEELPEASGLFFDELLRQLLEAPTVAAMAAHLAAVAPTGGAQPEPGLGGGEHPQRLPAPVVAGAEPGLLVPLATGEGATTVLVHDETGSLAPLRALAWDGAVVGIPGEPLDAGADLGTLAARYARRLRAAGHEHVRVVGHGLGATLALEVARAAADAGAQVEELTLVAPRRTDAAAPTLYAGDMSIVEAGPDLDFWQDLCLGDVRVVEGTRP